MLITIKIKINPKDKDWVTRHPMTTRHSGPSALGCIGTRSLGTRSPGHSVAPPAILWRVCEEIIRMILVATTFCLKNRRAAHVLCSDQIGSCICTFCDVTYTKSPWTTLEYFGFLPALTTQLVRINQQHNSGYEHTFPI